MTEQEINDQHNHIRTLIEQKRLKEALTQLESFLWQCTDYNLRTRLEQVQTSYNYMLQYMEQGSIDPDRKMLYTNLLADTQKIADQTRVLLMDGTSNHYYHECRRNEARNSTPDTTEKLMRALEAFNDDLAISELLSDNKLNQALKHHEETLKSLFIHTWVNSSWSLQDETEAQAMLRSELVPTNDLCLFTSAVMLSVMKCLDTRKLAWLIEAYQQSNTYVSQRALVGIIFTLHVHQQQIELYPNIKNRIGILNEIPDFARDLACIYRQMLLCQETEKIDKKMREEIIPEMLRNVSSMRNIKFGFEETEEEKDDRNPEWKNIFEQSGLSDKLREMNELQIEGADVYMSTFSNLKNFPFFKELHNWFYPFDTQHSSIIEKEKKSNLMELILQSGFFCNSDKYSLFFTVQQFPQSQRDMIFSQLTEQQVEEFAEQSKADTLRKFSERPATISNQYLHDLYRFFKLNSRRNEFRNIFEELLEIHKIPVLKKVLYNEYTLGTLVEYHLKKEHWHEIEEVCEEMKNLNELLSTQADFYEKMGYALQKQRKIEEAIVAYQKADTIKPNHLWTNRHLATCYRLIRNFNQALEYYRKVENALPGNHNIVFYIASCLAEEAQYEEALNYFFKLYFMQNNSVKAWRGIAWCSFMTKRDEQAQKYYNKIIEQQPLPIDYLNAGHVAWVSQNLSQTVQFYSKALASSENKDSFLKLFYKDKKNLIERGISEDDIPLMLDMI